MSHYRLFLRDLMRFLFNRLHGYLLFLRLRLSILLFNRLFIIYRRHNISPLIHISNFSRSLYRLFINLIPLGLRFGRYSFIKLILLLPQCIDLLNVSLNHIGMLERSILHILGLRISFGRFWCLLLEVEIGLLFWLFQNWLLL